MPRYDHVRKKRCAIGTITPMSDDDILAHLRGERDLFYTNHCACQLPLTVMDIDADDPQPALDCAEYLCSKFCSQHEPSTNGIGQHIPLWLDKGSLTSAEVNQRLAVLEERLNKAMCQKFAIKRLEIKGTITTADTFGYLCRLPRTIDLDKLPTLGVESIHPSSCHANVKTTGGSTREPYISDDIKDELPQAFDHFQSRAQYLLEHAVKPTGRKRLTVEDFQVTLVILSVVACKPNQDDQLPAQLVKSLWPMVADECGVDRAFDCNRWAAIWRTLADTGFIEVSDETYWFYPDSEKTGKAMQWHLREEHVYTFQAHHTHTICNNNSFTPLMIVPQRHRSTRVMPPEWRQRFLRSQEMWQLTLQVDEFLAMAG
jgi:hypothetical protein